MIWIMIYINLDFCTQTKYRNLLLNTQQKQRWNQISMKSQKSFKKSSKHFNPKQQVLKNAHTFRSKRTNFKKSSKHFNPKQQVLKNPKTFQSKTKVLKNPPKSSIKIKKFQKKSSKKFNQTPNVKTNLPKISIRSQKQLNGKWILGVEFDVVLFSSKFWERDFPQNAEWKCGCK